MLTILNCPFCGYHDIEIDEIELGIHAVCCPECETIGPSAPHVMDAISQWNKRAPVHKTLLDPDHVSD